MTLAELRQHCYDRLTAANLLGWIQIDGRNWERAIAALPHAQFGYSYPPERIDGKPTSVTGIECAVIDGNRIEVQPLLNSQSAVANIYTILLRTWDTTVSLKSAVEAVSHGLAVQAVRRPAIDVNADGFVEVLLLDVLAEVCEVG